MMRNVRCGLSGVAVAAALAVGPSSLPAEASSCSPACETILARGTGEQAARSAFQNLNNGQLKAISDLSNRRRLQIDAAMTALEINNKSVVAITSVVPVLGVGFDIVLGKISKQAEEGVARERAAFLDRKISELLDQGKPLQAVQGSLEGSIDNLIGPHSQFVTSLGLQPTEYDVLQTKSIEILAQEIDKLKDLTSAQRTAMLKTDTSLAGDAAQLAALTKQLAGLEGEKAQIRADSTIAAAGPTPQAIDAALHQNARQHVLEIAQVGQVAAQQIAATSTILKGLGVSPEVTDDINKGAQVLGAVSNLVGAFCGNPLGALPAIASVFGIFGHPAPDPMLTKILDGITAIRHDLAKIDEEIRENQKQVMDALQGIQYDLLELYSVLQDRDHRSEAACDHAWDVGGDGPGTVNPVTPIYSAPRTGILKPTLMNAPELRPVGYPQLKAVWQERGGAINDCQKFVESLFDDQIGVARENFTIKKITESAANPQTNDDLSQRYSNSRAVRVLFDKLSPVANHLSDDAQALFFWPTSTVQDLDWALDPRERLAAAVNNTTLAGEDGAAKRTWWVDAALDPDALSRATSELILTEFWHHFVNDATHFILDPDQATGADEVVREHLSAALNVVQLGFAQQTLIGGGPLLPLIYDRLLDVSSSGAPPLLLGPNQADRVWWSTKAAGDLSDLLSADPVLGRNFGLYFAHRRLQFGNHALLSYRVAYGVTNDSRFISELLGVGQYAWNADTRRWTVTVAGASVMLPSPDELSSGELFRTSSLGVLGVIRGQLVGEIAQNSLDPAGVPTGEPTKDAFAAAASIGALP